MALRIPRLQRTIAVTEPDGSPKSAFQQWWQKVAETIEAAVATLEEAVADIVAILVRLGLVEETADGALQLAESAINPDGTIKDDKVLTSSVAPNNITKTSIFFHDFGGWAIAPGSFVDVSNGGFTAQVAVQTTNYSEQGVGIDVLIAMNRAGGSDDNVTMHCVRTSDGAVLDQEYDYDVQGQNFTYAAKFYDDDPADSITETYKIQINSDDATVIRETYIEGFLTLR